MLTTTKGREWFDHAGWLFGTGALYYAWQLVATVRELAPDGLIAYVRLSGLAQLGKACLLLSVVWLIVELVLLRRGTHDQVPRKGRRMVLLFVAIAIAGTGIAIAIAMQRNVYLT